MTFILSSLGEEIRSKRPIWIERDRRISTLDEHVIIAVLLKFSHPIRLITLVKITSRQTSKQMVYKVTQPCYSAAHPQLPSGSSGGHSLI